MTVNINGAVFSGKTTISMESAPSGPPVVTLATPSYGSYSGGNTITITGQYFTGATSVKFGTADVASFTVVNDTTISVVTPAYNRTSTGYTPAISVTTPLGTGSAAGLFTFISAPSISSVSPSSGPVAGGNTVTFTGSNYIDVTSVKIGGIEVSSFTVVSSTTITAVAPSSAVTGDVLVYVNAIAGPVTRSGMYTYY